MDERIIAPIIERIKQDGAKESIKEEMLGFGYTSEEFETAYDSAIETLSKSAREEMTEANKKALPSTLTQKKAKPPKISTEATRTSKKTLLLAIASLLFALLGITVLVLLLIQANAPPTIATKSTTVTTKVDVASTTEKINDVEVNQDATTTQTTQTPVGEDILSNESTSSSVFDATTTATSS